LNENKSLILPNIVNERHHGSHGEWECTLEEEGIGVIIKHRVPWCPEKMKSKIFTSKLLNEMITEKSCENPVIDQAVSNEKWGMRIGSHELSFDISPENCQSC
jgi:hypothetical protein